MKTIINLIRFQLNSCLKTSYFIAPFVLLFIFLYCNYAMGPIEVISSFCITAMFVFVLMVWMGYSYVAHENKVMKQIVMLRINHESVYESGQILMQLVIAGMVGIIAILYPFLRNATSGFGLFTRAVTVSDVISSFLIITACGFLGGCIGRFFEPRVIRDSKMALLVLIMITAITVAKERIISAFTISRFVLWILPPVSDVTTYYSIHNKYTGISVLAGMLLLCGYGIAVSILGTLIQKKKGFN